MRSRSAGMESPFQRPRRREVARACSFGARTTAEVARQLATETGSVTTVIRSLVSEGILRETTVPHARGQAYELVQKHRPSLLEAVASEAPRGQLEPERRLLLVASRDGAAFARAAAMIAADPVVLWAARVDGPARLLVLLRSDTTAQRNQVDRLESALGVEGLDCIQLRIDRIMELGELTQYAHLLERGPQPPAHELAAG